MHTPTEDTLKKYSGVLHNIIQSGAYIQKTELEKYTPKISLNFLSEATKIGYLKSRTSQNGGGYIATEKLFFADLKAAALEILQNINDYSRAKQKKRRDEKKGFRIPTPADEAAAIEVLKNSTEFIYSIERQPRHTKTEKIL